jgi:hypothetical protein
MMAMGLSQVEEEKIRGGGIQKYNAFQHHTLQ